MARPRAFDRDDALQRAMETFWELGYERASAAVLERRMGIRRSSLYAAFGSKDELYREALDRYAEDLRARVVEPLRADGSGAEVLTAFFDAAACRGDGGADRTCMLVHAAAADTVADPAVRERVLASLAEIDRAFHELVERGVRDGSLRVDDVPAAALFLTTTYQALNVARRGGRAPEDLHAIARRALEGMLARAGAPFHEPEDARP